MLVFINDELVPEEDAKISVRDRGFIYGDGVFETLLLKNGSVFRVSEHLRRLEASASIVKIKLPWTTEELAERVGRTVRENRVREGIIRVNVSRGVGSWRLTVKGAEKPTLVITLYPPPEYPTDTFTKGWPIIISREVMVIDPVIPGRAKTTNRLNLILAKNEADEKNAAEAILLNSRGKLTEGTSTNIFFCREGKLLTPSMESGILEGVTRDIVIELAGAAGVEVIEGSYDPEDLYAADEAFLTFTTSGIVPVHSVDGNVLGKGKLGPITEKLTGSYETVVEKETRAMAKTT